MPYKGVLVVREMEDRRISYFEIIYGSHVLFTCQQYKNWKRRHFRLYSDGVLSYFKSEDERSKLLGQMQLADVRKVRKSWETDWSKLGSDCPKDAIPETRLEIVSDEKTLRFYCDSPEETERWFEALAKQLESFKKRKSTQDPTIFKKTRHYMRKSFREKLVPIHKGWVTKLGGRAKTWKQRYMVLSKNYVLHYWKDDLCLGAPIGSIQLKYTTKVTGGSEESGWESVETPSVVFPELRFALHSEARTYYLFTTEKEATAEWLKVLTEAFRACHIESRRGTLIQSDPGFAALAATREEQELLSKIASPAVQDNGAYDEDEDAEEDDSDVGDEDDEAEDLLFVDRYLDMYQLPHTQERRRILQEALRIGRSQRTSGRPRHVTIIYNPVSGAGKAKKNVDLTLVPVLEICGISFKITATTHRGHAREIASTFDYKKTDGLVVAGGDGLVSEVITGLTDRTDDCIASGFPVGLVPSGTANAMANELDLFESKTYVELIGATSLMVAEGNTRMVDVIDMTVLAKEAPKTAPEGRKVGSDAPNEVAEEVTKKVGGEDSGDHDSAGPDNVPTDQTGLPESRRVAGLSCVGWGLAGAVALKADQLRWLPGQRNFRYDIAGFVTLMKNWPLHCEADFELLVEDDEKEGELVWISEHHNMLNMIATNCHKLGVDHPIHPDTRIDDGWLWVVFMGGGHSRTDAARAGMYMKGGKFLSTHKAMSWKRVKEMKMTPTSKTDVPLLIDGDPWDVAPVHIKMLPRGINVFCKAPSKVTATEEAQPEAVPTEQSSDQTAAVNLYDNVDTA